MPVLGWTLQKAAGPQRGSQSLEVSLWVREALLQTLNHLSGVDIGWVMATMSCPGLREGL